MFEISNNNGDIKLVGRFDASFANEARTFFNALTETATVDFSRLDYIASAGLGVLLGAQKRLGESGHQLVLKIMSGHIRELFRIAGFDHVFEIE